MPPHSKPNFSPNWRHLKSILAAYPASEHKSAGPSFEDHRHAKALSMFLAHATLMTPPLDRKTVAEVLSGQRNWPREVGTSQFGSVSIPLSFLEENGFVTFYAGWVKVYLSTPRDLEKVHPSVLPLISALEHLKDIRYGRNGYIRPHYACPAQEFEELTSSFLGNTRLEDILPELRLEEELYRLTPGNRSFSSLVSTYLWRVLKEQESDTALAFKRWINCFCVNCTWVMPVQFGQEEREEREAFNKSLTEWLANDSTLQQPAITLQKQFQNQHIFPAIVSPTITKIFVDISLNNDRRPERDETVELEKPTLDTLSACYNTQNVDNLSSLQNVIEWSRSHMSGHDMFYSGLLASTLDTDVRIDGQMLISSGVVETLLELATTRPILQHLLFNVIPIYQSVNYQVFLLSKSETCDVAFFYLTQNRFFQSNRNSSSALRMLEEGFHKLVFQEYLRTISNEPDLGNRLLRIVEFLSGRINLTARFFSTGPEYRLLMNVLDHLGRGHVIQLVHAFVNSSPEESEFHYHRSSDHYMYLLGFWLSDYLDNIGTESSETLNLTLKAAIRERYESEFNRNLAGDFETLKPTGFFSTLPWDKIFIGDNLKHLQSISNKCHLWQTKLDASNQKVYSIASAIRHHLQVLMCVGKPQRAGKEWERIAVKVAQIVRILGFGDQDKTVYIFQSPPIGEDFDLWKSFCSYTNFIPEAAYEDFVHSCVALIPLNQLFVLHEHTTIVVRAKALADQIAIRQSAEAEDMGLLSVEQAFVSACESGLSTLSEKLLHKGKEILERRFGKSEHPEVVLRRKRWKSYEYKWTLIDKASKFDENPDAFINFARELEIPHKQQANHFDEDDQAYWKDCDFFRRCITATAYLKISPGRCVQIMEALYKDSKREDHSFVLFKGRIALYEKNNDASFLRQALYQFLDAVKEVEPHEMPNQWPVAILEAYMRLRETSSIDVFWGKLSTDQKNTAELLHPYAKSLIACGEPHAAKQVILKYRDHNRASLEDLDLDDLIDELAKALPEELSMSSLVQTLNEQSQRTIVQLRKHYRQIVSSEFTDYADIVQEKSPEEFLSDIILEVAQELTLRKKNLQIHEGRSNKLASFRITKEDLINDWFTSLFDKRMAEARIGFRDQKRAGISTSGKNPGEVDGYITDAKNKRIAIFEAFRLFSMDTAVISEHLDKIAGYDNESLSPVFVVGYCDVRDFSDLVRGYTSFIVSKEYTGFTAITGGEREVKTLTNTDHLWMGMDRRQRGARDISFYHLLLNMKNDKDL